MLSNPARSSDVPDPAPVTVAVIGAGPRGVIMTERLCANAEEIAPGRGLVVHLIDPFPAGGGRVWREDQNRHLLMNTVAGDISVFTDPTVTCQGPVIPGPTQYEWARQVAAGEVTGQDPAVTAEAEQMQAWSYATRAFQGAYLRWALDHVLARAPRTVRVHQHRTRAVGLEESSPGEQCLHLQSGELLPVDAAVLAQGHFDVDASAAEQALEDFATANGCCYLAPASPSEVDMETIAAGEPTLLRGLGLNFYDYVTLLTVGRGGSFERDAAGNLVYQASGREPALLAGSGRGVPYTARAEVRKEVVPRYQPRFLDATVIRQLRQHAGTGRLDFRRDLWPHVVKETAWVYYQHLLDHGDLADADKLARFRAQFPALPAGCADADALIAELVPSEARWDWERLDRPADGKHFSDRDSFTRWVRDRIADDHHHAGLGPDHSALKAAAAMLRDLRDEVRQVVSHRGLAGESYHRDVERWFSGLANYAASGPPALRVEELGALVDAGVVRFLGPAVRISADPEQGRFRAESAAVDEEPALTRVLIEAHLPATDLNRTTDPLLRGLLDRGAIASHVIPDASGQDYRTGGIDITEGEQRTVDALGRPHPARFCFGPPVESVQWVTAIGARPHVNSRTLLQADAIARAALEAPRVTPVTIAA